MSDSTLDQMAPSEDMRAARRRWASGVAVVTTLDGDGFRGATVTSFAAVSLEPPLVLVCLACDGQMSDLVPRNRVFAVSILEREHEFLSERFAGRAPLPNRQFTGIPYVTGVTGCPLLTHALAWYDCQVRDVHDGGDHVVILGGVIAATLGDDTDDPLLTYEAKYRRIEPD